MKFSIRDLLLVTVIVALAVGWWVDRSLLAARNAEWGNSIHHALKKLAKELPTEYTFETPSGSVTARMAGTEHIILHDFGEATASLRNQP